MPKLTDTQLVILSAAAATRSRVARLRPGARLADQISDFWRDSWSAWATLGLPAPESFETKTMPANNSFGLDNDDRFQNARPEPIEPDE